MLNTLEKIVAALILAILLAIIVVVIVSTLVYVSSFGVIPLIITYVAILAICIFIAID